MYTYRTCNFSVRTDGAGNGSLEVEIFCNNQPQACSLVKLSDHSYNATFTPKHAHPHLLHVFYCGSPIPGSPFRLQVSADVNVVVHGRSVEATPINKQALFIVDASEATVKAEPKIKILGGQFTFYAWKS